MMRIAVAGAGGRMGKEVLRAVTAEDDLQLVCAFDPRLAGQPLGDVVPELDMDLIIEGSPEAMMEAGAEAMVDFTNREAARRNIDVALHNGIAAVVGTTGFDDRDLANFRSWCEEVGGSCLIAPNFSLGALLMMKFSVIAARYMQDCEIIELHHTGKLDAPSGTALRTAELITLARAEGNARESSQVPDKPAAESRGKIFKGIPVHSIRLPGLVAHQEVIFGGQGQILTIRHDSIDRTSFMPGVIFALRHISKHPGFTFGLENWLDI